MTSLVGDAARLKAYPTYKATATAWLGKVPTHWSIQPGRSVLRQQQHKNHGMIEAQVLSLSYGRIVVKPVEKLHGLVPASFETYQIVDPGDIIIRPTDLQNDWTSLRVGLSGHRGIITSAYLCLRAALPLTAEYAYLLLHAYDLMKVFYGLGSGLRQNLDFADFKWMPMLVPPTDEQVAIVRFLDQVDRQVRRYISAKRRLIALLNEQKQSIINGAVTQGLDANARMKPSGVEWLGEVPEHWNIKSLKYVASVQTGLTLGKQYAQGNLEEYPYLRVANVQDGWFDLAHITKVRVPRSEALGCLLQHGDVLMTEGGDRDKLGRGYVWAGEIPNCLHQNHIFAVRPDLRSLIPEFLSFAMASHYCRMYFLLTAKQTTNLASTNSTTLKGLPLVLPPLAEQQQIVNELRESLGKLENAIATAGREIELLTEYRIRQIADIVTGQLDVREAARNLPDDLGNGVLADEAAPTDLEEALPDEMEAVADDTEE